MTAKIIGIYGKSNSGKTTLVKKIIKYYSKKKLKIASIKISDKNIGIDKTRKDTYKHAKAGAKIVVFSTKNETDYLIKKHQNLKNILKTLCEIDDFDLILIEGANDDFTSKIRIGDIKKRKNTIYDYHNNFEDIIDIINNKILEDNI